jgi:hypothetical protein
VANLRLLSLVTKAIFYLKKGIQLIDFGAERFGIFRMHWSRYPLQSPEKSGRIFTAIGAKEEIFCFF